MANKNRNKGAMICPNCGKLINANSEKCIHCGLKYPGKQNISNQILALFKQKLGFFETVMYFCSGLFIISILIDPSALFNSRSMFSLFSPSMIALDKLGMTGTYAMANGRWWTLITAIYLHGGVLHILFNMLWIRQLAPTVEDLFGTSRLIIIFTLSGILGFILSNLFQISFTIGASGSIFGLLGALIFYGKDRGGFFGEALFKQLIGWAIILFVFGFLFPGINNWAHAGGFAGGYLSARLLGYNEKKPETITYKNLASMTIVITIICFVIAVWKGFF